MDYRVFSLPEQLIREHGTRDPFTLAERLRIRVRYVSTDPQKGFCTNILNNFFIFINENMSRQMQRMTCAHELGHILLHKGLLGRDEHGHFKKLVEMELFDITNQTEYEANLFAANLLIDDEHLMEMLEENYDIVSIASSFHVNVNMLAIKLAEMNKNGLGIFLPFAPDRRFMGRIRDRADSF